MTDEEIIERMNLRNEILAERRQEQLHEYHMRTNLEYFEEYSEHLKQFRESREGLVKELYKYNLKLKPEDFL